MLTDDSAGEQRAVAATFPGSSIGEREVTHLFCTEHSDATIRKKFPGKSLAPVANALCSALYNQQTRQGCEQSLKTAIDAAPFARLREYIRKEWVETAPAWAHYARCHSHVILQVTTTNALESWHSTLKHGIKQPMLTWSLCGIVQHVANVALGYKKRAKKAASKWMSGRYSDSTLYPGLCKLPGPLQLLTLREREGSSGRKRISQLRKGQWKPPPPSSRKRRQYRNTFPSDGTQRGATRMLLTYDMGMMTNGNE